MKTAEFPKWFCWIVPILLSVCGALLSVILIFYMGDREATREDQRELRRSVQELTAKVAETNAKVLILLGHAGGPAPKSSESAGGSVSTSKFHSGAQGSGRPRE